MPELLDLLSGIDSAAKQTVGSGHVDSLASNPSALNYVNPSGPTAAGNTISPPGSSQVVYGPTPSLPQGGGFPGVGSRQK